MSARVVKTFDTRQAAERFAKQFDHARTVTGFKPLAVEERDGVFVILRDDRQPVRDAEAGL
jgi:hypothetical protein